MYYIEIMMIRFRWRSVFLHAEKFNEAGYLFLAKNAKAAHDVI